MPVRVADLRLVPAALAAWAGAAAVVALTARGALVVAGVAAAGALACALICTLARGRGDRRPWARAGAGQVVLVLAVVAVVAAAGAVQLHERGSGPLADLARQRATVRLVGVVRSAPVPIASPWGWGGGTRYRLELAAEQVSGRGRAGPAAAPVLVFAGAGWQHAAYGARLEVSGTLAPSTPGDSMLALVTARAGPRVLAPPGAVDRAVGAIWADLRAVAAPLAPDARGLVPGIAVGDTSRLPADLDAAMRVAGLTHVTAVSGAHFAIIGAAVLGVAAAVGLPRRARVVAAAAALGGLLVLVHAEPSVLRAAAMGSVGLAGLVVGRPSRALPALGATVIALLVMDPWLGRDPGFALSVLATAGIVQLTEPLSRRISGGVLGDRAGYAIAVPIAAQAACAPVIILLNPALATYAVPANLAVAPALAPATVFGVLTALVAPWWPAAAAVLVLPAGAAAWWIAAVARAVAGLPAAQLPWPGGFAGALALAGLTVAAALAVRRLGARAP
ncbi:ComEC/Rec2 family competence protein [Pengzhenrongella sicca]|uniref:ComEC/Rec2 family competence protein n=1 Tax=Pengzhenrongella sicca TaxID=2819238 RepID=A0A8A4ZD74_9MICO|nr:ComEC/Rec2 family competence protein [Pengzhenrongella sicca]QTE28496.1 ComEC/Rec2 family competence protein [Pengzhenrongella sicca]